MKPRIYKPTAKKEDFETNGLGILSDATRCDVTEEANGRYDMELEYPLNSRFKMFFRNGYQIKAKPNDIDKYMIFEIKNVYEDTVNNNILVFGQSRTLKLGYREIQHLEINAQHGASVMKEITSHMDAKSDIELYSDIETVSSTLFEARNVLNCIAGEQGSMLQLWGGEIRHEPFRLSLLKRRGRDNVGTIRYGKDLTGLKIKEDWSPLITRVLPYAEVQSDKDGQTKRIYGTAVDSEYIKSYPDIYAHHIQFTEEQGVTDLNSLNKVAKRYFKSINPGSDQLKISIELELEKLTDSKEAEEFSKLRNYGLFDTFTVYHSLYDIKIESKITTVVYDSLNEKVKKIHAGDSRMSFFEKQNYDLQETIKTISKKEYMSEFINYVTTIISGNDGGHVIWWPKNRPTDLFFCDKPSLEEAKQVLRINKSGIGFSKNGWKGPFNTAWTLDGVLTLGDGMLQIGTDGTGKYLENTKDGLKFFNNNTTVGTIGVAAKQFPGFKEKDDLETKKALSIEIENGDFFKVQTSSPNDKEVTGIYVPNPRKNKSTGDVLVIANQGDKNSITINAGGTELHVLKNRVNVAGADLYVRGEKVFPGQHSSGGNPGGGAGGWNGLYPKEVTTSADKYAWQFWILMDQYGYSPAAKAGILGNIEGEVGPPMNPDMHQVGGPAYGCTQWDGSAYPLVGPPTWDGRQYVQTLMDAAKINDDYRTYKAQCQLIEWCMFNGQWIGKVAPTSVTEFKKMTSPESAAYVFENNYERPAWSHPEREGHARKWYEKFKNLKQPTGSGKYVSPMNSYVVTSEFGWRNSPLGGGMEFHNAIDMANGTGTPIFAAQEGEVIQASGEYFSWYGNYVVIKHPDGLYTGYAHLNRIDVQRGQRVHQGQRLGTEGSTGPVTGPHLHFQFMRRYWPQGNDDFENPRKYINL